MMYPGVNSSHLPPLLEPLQFIFENEKEHASNLYLSGDNVRREVNKVVYQETAIGDIEARRYTELKAFFLCFAVVIVLCCCNCALLLQCSVSRQQMRFALK